MESCDDDGDENAIVSARKVGYTWSKEYEEACNCLPSNIGRRPTTPDDSVIEPSSASVDDLCTFHDSEYIEFLLNSSPQKSCLQKRKRSSSSSSTSSTSTTEDPYETFGLEYVCSSILKPSNVKDCAPFQSLPQYISLLGGAAIQSATLLPNYDVIIHWDGGRHHALRSSASGYCYLADIPLSILTLLQNYKTVLYVDLDAHHGDGVEFAFAQTEKVITLSFHVYEPGFFPGTGSGKESGKGLYNVPLERGTKAPIWEETVKRCIGMVWEKYTPDCIVVQCGCDGTHPPLEFKNVDIGLLTDPHRALQLTTFSFQRVINKILEFKVATLLLGGGGYHPESAAKHFTLLTALVLGKVLDEDIPLEAEYWEELEKDGGIHVGRDSSLTEGGKIEVERLCIVLHQKLGTQ